MGKSKEKSKRKEKKSSTNAVKGQGNANDGVLKSMRKKVKRDLKKKYGRSPTKDELATKLEETLANHIPSESKGNDGNSKALSSTNNSSAPTTPSSIDHELKKKTKKALKKELGRKPTKEELRERLHNATNQNGSTKCSSGHANTPLTAADILDYRKKSALTVSGTPTASEDFPPFLKFESSGISRELLKFCKDFDRPTPIQAQCWPVIMNGGDCIGIAKTGSGKTIAFGLPGLMHVSKKKEGVNKPRKPSMCVIAPTRELAVQTFEVCEEAGKIMEPPVRSVCVYGGVPKGPQTAALRKGVGIVVATPGRLYDLMSQGEVELSDVSYMVLDEADRMLDLGFEKEIKHFMASCRKDRQTLMFSATWPMEVQSIGQSYMRQPIRVTVGDVDRLAANHAVTQTVEVLEGHQKDARLMDLLSKIKKQKGSSERILVFALYKKEAARLETTIRRAGYSDATAIHGDLSQDRRAQVLESFKEGSVKIMIATDVAARGLDVPELNYVINYTFPLTVEDYVHRVGRTGRAGNKGTSYTFFTSQDKGLAGSLGNVLREAGEKVPEALMKFGQGTKRKKHSVYGELTATQEAMLGKKATRIKFD